ncbi:hypothetical protein GCM10010193_28900 [Kitasatospora atroaurantiaca]|uniref:non-specific serine/threonine protein kinase n=1 Tax=Kitasatospora atroaurantiaca TaxID=285545 RepID=A0A561EIX0_9ACTN|nr:hypothetical protein [Kitasatospora atroaurantiaca]TWE15558.1 hypothetical protein FB465_0458 [Kitasatospora atroaurantiaca]
MSPDPTGPVTPTVDHGSLALGRQLGQGGQGSVHQVLNKRINESAGGGWEVVYKEYSANVLPHLDEAALASSAALLGELSGADGRWLSEKTAWPAAVVQRQGRTCGFLMRAVPDRFQFSLRTLTGANGGPRRLANMEYLLNDDTYIAGIGLTVSDKDRLLLLADLAATLARLHRLGIAVGDLSPRNLLFSASPQPECFLIDCDAMRLRGATALPQAETPDWQVPAGEERATPTSDVYKLGLLAVRLFARNQTSTDPTALAATSPALGDLARASLDPDPARRPTPAAWAEQLTSAAATAPAKPARKRRRTPGAATPAAPPTRPATGRPHGTTPPAPKSPAAQAGGVLGALAAVVVLILLVVNNQHSLRTDTSGSTVGGSRQTARYTPHPLDTRTTPTPTRTRWETTPDPVRTTSAPPTPTDAIGTAHVGDCFDDKGTNGHADLSTTSCTSGAFKVVRINTATTDLDSCDNVPDSDRSVSSSRHDLVLCLSYQSPGGTAYHAGQGDCVFGAPGGSAWGKQACQTGNFKVLAAYRGTSDKSKCDPWPHYNYWRHFSVAADSRLDVLLCLSMNYPDDAGYATVKECLSKSGSTFTNVGSCNASNVYVTGRTSTPNAPAFCGHDGSTYWRSADYPAFGYTVCWRWR